MREDKQLSLESWLTRIHAMRRPECPPPESLHRFAIQDLTAVQRKRLQEHLSECRECAAEHDMAMLFERNARSHADADEVAEIVARLEAESPVRPGARSRRPGGQAGVRPPRAGWFTWPSTLPAWQLAAGAAVVVVLAVATWPRPPTLPAAHETTLRGTTVRTISPRDDVAVSPTVFTWHPHPDATTYRVQLMGVDDTVLWEGLATGGRIDVPAATSANLQPLVRYVWTVEGLNEAGALVAASGPQRFRILGADTPPVSRDN